jgi:LuxR family maltose regulon positive regulatory protein
VSLDEIDSDLVTFIGVLVSALRTVMPTAGRQALALAAQTDSPPLSRLSALLVDDLAGLEDGLVVVLDDFHLIREPAVHALLSMLMRHLPPTVQLVLASREEPPLPLALLRGRRELAEVRADDLRFDRAEASAFVRGMSGPPPDNRLVADAVDRSEGWAVGLRLLTLVGSPSASAQPGSTPVAAREHRVVDAYLFDEVLSRQTPQLQRFLMQISILDRFCTPLCEAVVDGLLPGDAQRLLEATMTAGLFLMSLDGERRWCRFHNLFRDALRRRLERETAPERVRALRLRASDWLAGHGSWDEAARQAIDANDVDRVTSLVETCLLTDRSIGTGLMVEAWIRRLPGHVVDANATLSLARCAPLGPRGQVGAVESESRRIETMLTEEPSCMSPALLPIARGQIDVQLAWVLCERGGADQEAHDHVRRALDLLPADQYDFRGIAASIYPNTLHYLGRTDDALAWIGAELGQGVGLHPEYIARILIGQSHIERASGRLPTLVHTGRRIVAFGDEHHSALMLGWGHFTLGSVAYEWNDLSAAREHFEAVLALGQVAQRMCTVNSMLSLAQTLVAQGQPAEAERLVLAELEQVEGTRDTFFLQSLRSFMARLALASNNLDRATYWLAGVALTRKNIAGYDSEYPLLTRARVLLAGPTDGDLDEASVAANRAIEAAEARHVVGYVVKGLAVRALIERSRGDNGSAARSLAQALEIAEPGRFTRSFVDLGPPLTGLLAELASHGGLPRGGRGCSTRAGRSPPGWCPAGPPRTASRRVSPRC